MDALLRTLQAATLNLGWQLFVFLGPVVACCVLLHWLEKALNRRMESLLGRSRIYLTGWVGTPIHELSHALMCKVFGHKVREIVLFRPDEDGRLGYVKHAFDPKSLYQRIGNFFIGIAPLFGGAAVLWVLLLFVHPDPGALDTADLSSVGAASGLGAKLQALVQVGGTLTWSLFAPGHYGQWRFWLFAYLALAVGSHLAPSRVDLRNGFSGGVLCLLLLFALNLLLVLTGFDLNEQLRGALHLLSPLLAMLFLAVILNVVWLGVVTPLSWLRR